MATTLRSLTLTAAGSIAVLGAVLAMRAASPAGEAPPAGGGRWDHAVVRAAAPGAAPVRPAAPADDLPSLLRVLLTLAMTPYDRPPAGS
ncbi:hypothetical protein AB0D67_06820 [Streptosporangium sp. NPDC048047]|uniref:hypothetical protein n=1 Tax=Streptosporangium sp. NPDC048047 TaxID=3155748 RepID=UPI003447E98E